MTKYRRRKWARRRPQREFARQLWVVCAGLPLDAATIRALADVARRQRDGVHHPRHNPSVWFHWHETYLWLQHEATRADDAARRAGGVA